MKVRGALYIQTYEHTYKVITRYDTILQEFYITDRRKCKNIKRYTIMNSTKDAHELQKGKLESLAGGLVGKGFERSVDYPRFYCATLINNRENSQTPNSKIWTCRSRRVRNSPMSDVINVKWHSEINTYVSINTN